MPDTQQSFRWRSILPSRVLVVRLPEVGLVPGYPGRLAHSFGVTLLTNIGDITPLSGIGLSLIMEVGPRSPGFCFRLHRGTGGKEHVVPEPPTACDNDIVDGLVCRGSSGDRD
jgi:hypothetical protein